MRYPTYPLLLASFALLLLVVPGSARAQSETTMIGPISVEQMLDIPGWFGPDFLSYAPRPDHLERLRPHMSDVTVRCFVGTWCDDSRVHIPRLLRLLQMLGVDPARLTAIGLDRNKRSPGGEERLFGIELVPTIILLRGDREIGRIVEHPSVSLEHDMLGMFEPVDVPVPPAPDSPPPPLPLQPDGTPPPDAVRPPDTQHPDTGQPHDAPGREQAGDGGSDATGMSDPGRSAPASASPAAASPVLAPDRTNVASPRGSGSDSAPRPKRTRRGTR